MSESVRIPVSYGINNHTYAEVTPDLARQIVLLACDVSEETTRVAAERDRAVARLKEISEIDKAYQGLTAERDRALDDLRKHGPLTPAQLSNGTWEYQIAEAAPMGCAS